MTRQISKQHWDFIARKPRHEAGDTSGFELTFLVDDRQISAELMDCSRNGMRVVTSGSMPNGTELIVVAKAELGAIDWSIPAFVRWSHPAANGWECGVRFVNELEWERLGELLLCGILSID